MSATKTMATPANQAFQDAVSSVVKPSVQGERNRKAPSRIGSVLTIVLFVRGGADRMSDLHAEGQETSIVSREMGYFVEQPSSSTQLLDVGGLTRTQHQRQSACPALDLKMAILLRMPHVKFSHTFRQTSGICCNPPASLRRRLYP